MSRWKEPFKTVIDSKRHFSAGGGGEIEPAEGRQQHGAGHVDGDRGPAGAGLAERLAEAQRLVVHHAPQVGAAGVGRRGGAAVEEREAGEEA